MVLIGSQGGYPGTPRRSQGVLSVVSTTGVWVPPKVSEFPRDGWCPQRFLSGGSQASPCRGVVVVVVDVHVLLSVVVCIAGCCCCGCVGGRSWRHVLGGGCGGARGYVAALPLSASSCHLSWERRRAFMKKFPTVLSSRPSCCEMVICISLEGRLVSLKMACRVRRCRSVNTRRGFLGWFLAADPDTGAEAPPGDSSFRLQAAQQERGQGHQYWTRRRSLFLLPIGTRAAVPLVIHPTGTICLVGIA
ncbi:unnamed protein product [Ixodes pacificus]